MVLSVLDVLGLWTPLANKFCVAAFGMFATVCAGKSPSTRAPLRTRVECVGYAHMQAFTAGLH